MKMLINAAISRLSAVLSLEAISDVDALGQNRLIFLKSFLNRKIRKTALIRWLTALSHQEKCDRGVLDEDDVKNNYFWLKLGLKLGFLSDRGSISQRSQTFVL